MLLQVSNLKKSFGERVIFEGVSFTLDAAQKLSIVGVNGAGKTTLIRTILKEIEPDRGSVTMPGGTTVGYIAQEQGLDSNLTVMEELMRSRPEVLELEERMSSLRESMEGVRGDASLSASGPAATSTQKPQCPQDGHLSLRAAYVCLAKSPSFTVG